MRTNTIQERINLPHGSSILVLREGKILACKRKTSELWGYPGGKIGEAESPIFAAARELWEETGIKALPEDLEFIYEGVCTNRDPNDTPYWVYFFRLAATVSMEPCEMRGEPPFQWMHSIDFLAQSAFPDFNETTLKKAEILPI